MRSPVMSRSLRGLDWLNFFVANFQTGFGPFISVYLTGAGWTQGAIGAALSVGTIAGMVSQVPGGAFTDAVRNKRWAIAGAITATMVSALLIALWPNLLSIGLAEILHSFAASVMNPAIAALSLALVHPSVFGERLGRNARFAAIGNAVAAGLMGLCGSYLSDRAVFFVTASLCLPGLAALAAIRKEDLGRFSPQQILVLTPAAQFSARSWQFLRDRKFITYFICACLFHVANAAMLPIAAGMVTKRAGTDASALIAACIVGPQVVTALISPWAGRAAERWGRRPMLVLGFSALPIRAALLAAIPSPYLIILIQLFDGLGAAVFGVLTPLVVSDITRDTGRYTTSLGIIGLAIGGGATLSTTAAGLVADHLGAAAAFLSLAAVGLGATLLVGTLMPETRPPAITPPPSAERAGFPAFRVRPEARDRQGGHVP
ncbi:MAG TPA: MFS transporter [Stellaceae bacterium]|nr:MFS transporter [Stellaceae bacterium]